MKTKKPDTPAKKEIKPVRRKTEKAVCVTIDWELTLDGLQRSMRCKIRRRLI
jgi:hypothetical protein